MKTADKFSLTRIILSPVFFVLYFIPVWTGRFAELSVYILVPLLGFMEFTDYLDGHYARKHNEVSDFGKLFDPFADVLVHLTIFLCFVISGYMPPLIFVLIIYREYGIVFIRMMALKEGVAMGARKGGKAKTVLYIVAGFYSLVIECLLRLGLPLFGDMTTLHTVGIVLYVIALIASYTSFIDYLVYFRKMCGQKDGDK